MDDLDKIAAWMSGQGLGDGPLENVTEIGGGTQNILLKFTRSGRDYVFRRGPEHLRPISNKVMLRETQVLAALAGTDVPHPRLIAVCDDTEVLGDAVFYLMEPLDGFNAGQELPRAACRRSSHPLRRWGCRWPTRWPSSAPSTTSRSDSRASVNRTDSWNGKCHGGFRNSKATPASTTTAAPISVMSTVSPPGSPSGNQKTGSRASFTATTTPRT